MKKSVKVSLSLRAVGWFFYYLIFRNIRRSFFDLFEKKRKRKKREDFPLIFWSDISHFGLLNIGRGGLAKLSYSVKVTVT